MSRFVFKGAQRNTISFPLGGIGTGSLGLSGTGRFIDWEIYNRPAKGSLNGFSHFAIKAEENGQVLDARVMNADLPPPYTGTPEAGARYHAFGFGPERGLMSGAPHFRDCVFTGKFPFAKIDFADGPADKQFPGAVSLSAFNPFIPLNDRDSSIPAAFFEVEVRNTTGKNLDYTICLSIANPYQGEKRNAFRREGGVSAITLSPKEINPQDCRSGDMSFAVMGGEHVSYQEYWYWAQWFNNIGVFWREFCQSGPLKNRAAGDGNASLAVRFKAAAGESRRLRFILAWNHPNNNNDWDQGRGKNAEGAYKTWKNYYAALFENSFAAATYGLENWDRLEGETRRFADALYASTLPEEALDAVCSNLAVLKSPTVWRLEDGSLYGWEGAMTDRGSCEGSCTHVWNYAYALPFLFPALERSIRELDFKYNLRPDGSMAFRLMLPLGSKQWEHRACVDGQMGGLIKTYREWKISGDTGWLRKLWPAAKRSLEFAWSRDNRDQWDPEQSGVISGRQHHTLDMELFGPNSWLEGFYLAALKAAAEMAEALGDGDAARYRELFAKGKAWTDKNLFNGEYYHQAVNLKDKALIESYEDNNTHLGTSVLNAYWNAEAEEMKCQIGGGCEIDQVIAQWHANLCGLGEIFDKAQVKSALKAIHRYNYKPSLREVFNPCRVYGLNDEAGALICEWPEGVYKPFSPLPYAEETQHGYEYEAAICMIQEGLEKEGLDIVRGIRDRYTGENRNPWNEMECGSNYARSMASFSLLPAYSGFSFDMTKGEIGFNPIRPGAYFWSLDKAWGVYEEGAKTARLRVLYGVQGLRRICLGKLRPETLSLEGKALPFRAEGAALILEEPLSLEAGQTLSFA